MGHASRGQKQAGGRQRRGWTAQRLAWTRGPLRPRLPAQVSSSVISPTPRTGSGEESALGLYGSALQLCHVDQPVEAFSLCFLAYEKAKNNCDPVGLSWDITSCVSWPLSNVLFLLSVLKLSPVLSLTPSAPTGKKVFPRSCSGSPWVTREEKEGYRERCKTGEVFKKIFKFIL